MPAPDTIIVNKHVILQRLAKQHAAPLLKLVNENRVYLQRWLSWVEFMQQVEDFERYIDNSLRLRKAGTDDSFCIYVDGVLAGRIGVHYISTFHRTGAIGYWLAESQVGKGIITNCCTTLLQHAFNKLNLNRVEIKCAVGNFKSNAIPKRLGFQFEGVQRQAELVNGVFLDLEVYALLKEDWESRAT